MVFLLRFCFILAFVVFALSFTIGNMQEITLAFPPLTYTLTLPLHMALYALFSSGIIAGLFSATCYYRRKILRIDRLLKQTTLEKNALQQQITTEKTEQFAEQQLLHAPRF